jgi:hypothetical protein
LSARQGRWRHETNPRVVNGIEEVARRASNIQALAFGKIARDPCKPFLDAEWFDHRQKPYQPIKKRPVWAPGLQNAGFLAGICSETDTFFNRLL